MKIMGFWDVTPCSSIDGYQRFPSQNGGSKVSPKRWYLSTKIHFATFRKTIIVIGCEVGIWIELAQGHSVGVVEPFSSAAESYKMSQRCRKIVLIKRIR
jgi:hypothetical protein